MDRKKLIFTVLIFVLLGIMIFACKNSKAESGWINTPDPSANFDDYVSDHPFYTPTPSPEPTPTPSPAPRPPLMAPSLRYFYVNWQGWHYVQTTDLEERSLTPRWTMGYQKLISPYPIASDPPSVDLGVSLTNNNGYFTTDWSNLSSSNRPTLNRSDSESRFGVEYIRTKWVIYCGNSTTTVQGQGLDYGLDLEIRNRWAGIDIIALDGFNLDTIPVYIIMTMQNDLGILYHTETYKVSLLDLSNGVDMVASSYVEGRKLNKIFIYTWIGITEEALLGTYNEDGIGHYYLTATYNPSLVIHVNDRPYWWCTLSSLNQLLAIPDQIADKITELFVPNSTQFQTWIDQHTSHDLDEGNPLNTAKDLFVQFIQILTNHNVSQPIITLPAMTVNIGGSSYQWFNGYSFNLNQADIQLGAPLNRQTLFYWTRLAGDLTITFGFAVLLRKWFDRIYDLYLAQ